MKTLSFTSQAFFMPAASQIVRIDNKSDVSQRSRTPSPSSSTRSRKHARPTRSLESDVEEEEHSKRSTRSGNGNNSRKQKEQPPPPPSPAKPGPEETSTGRPMQLSKNMLLSDDELESFWKEESGLAAVLADSPLIKKDLVLKLWKQDVRRVFRDHFITKLVPAAQALQSLNQIFEFVDRPSGYRCSNQMTEVNPWDPAGVRLWKRLLKNSESARIDIENDIDDEGPTDGWTTFVTDLEIAENVDLTRRTHCHCVTGCPEDSAACKCRHAQQSSNRDVVIYNECTQRLCHPYAKGRMDCCVTEQGRTIAVKIFKTERRGWALATLEPIPKGTFVGTYAGLVVPKEETVNVVNDYLFDLDHVSPTRYVIDARTHGNIFRLLNHSCEPNLEKRLMRGEFTNVVKVAFFSTRDIEAGEELNFSYSEDTDKNRKRCLCGSKNCRGNL